MGYLSEFKGKFDQSGEYDRRGRRQARRQFGQIVKTLECHYEETKLYSPCNGKQLLGFNKKMITSKGHAGFQNCVICHDIHFIQSE